MKTLTLTAPVELQAAAAGEKSRRVRILAYSGGPVRLQGMWSESVFDLTTLSVPRAVPLLADHRAEIGGVIGQAVPTRTASAVTVEAKLANVPEADRILALLAEGVQLQASIGAVNNGERYVKPGATATVNGRRVTASERGLVILERATLREVSITPTGADVDTSVIAARAAGGITMNFNEWLESCGVDANTLTEDRRGRLLQAHAALYPPTEGPATAEVLEATLHGSPLLQRAMQEGWTAARARTEHVAWLRASLEPNNRIQAFNPHTGGGSRVAATSNHLTAALLCRSGFETGAVQALGADVVQQSRDLRFHHASLLDLAAAALRIDGRDVPHDRNNMLRAAFSTGTLPTALGVAGDKALEMAWTQAAVTWRSWCAIKSSPNFRQQTGLRPSWAGNLTETPDTGSIDHGSVSETTYTWKLATFAKMYRIGRQAIINDDLGVFSDILPGLARAGARTLADKLYELLLANTGSFYSAGNNNLQTGGGSALSVTSLGTAVKNLRNQKDPDGNTLDVQPAVLLVPPTLEVTARGLLNSAEVWRTGADMLPSGNPLQNLAKLEVEPRLENASFTGSSTTQWYLHGGPQDLPFVVAFLNGAEFPKTEFFGLDSEPDNLGMSFRCYHDWAVAFGEKRASQKSAGA